MRIFTVTLTIILMFVLNPICFIRINLSVYILAILAMAPDWKRLFNLTVLTSPELYENCLTNDEEDIFDSSNYNRSCVIRILLQIFQNNYQIQLCKEAGPLLTHAKYKTGCSMAEKRAFQSLFPVILLLCLFGNALNLRIYRLAYFKGANAIHFLKFKAVAK